MFTPNKKRKILNSPLSEVFGSSDFALTTRDTEKRKPKTKD
jgi:hypothetical protein